MVIRPGQGRRPGRRRHGSALVHQSPTRSSPAVAARTMLPKCCANRHAGAGAPSDKSRKWFRSLTNIPQNHTGRVDVAGDAADGGYRLVVGTKAERQAARKAVSDYHEAQLGELIEHVAMAIDRYRTGEVDAYTVDETIHHYHRAARETIGQLVSCGNSAGPAGEHSLR